MSAGGRSVFSQVFQELMFDVEYFPYPETWQGDPMAGKREDDVIDMLEYKLSTHPELYAGIIIEPLVQGAGGMRVCREEFLQKLHWLNRQFDTLLIFDEVMTGFGRTGDWFAASRAHVEPDIIALSKGITGGFLPLAVTVCSDKIYDAFNTKDPLGTLWHGHSYTANPLGCAAALASLDLLEKNEDRFKNMEAVHIRESAPIREMAFVEKARFKGTIAAFNIQTGDESGYFNKAANLIKEKCVEYDLLIRPLGDVEDHPPDHQRADLVLAHQPLQLGPGRALPLPPRQRRQRRGDRPRRVGERDAEAPPAVVDSQDPAHAPPARTARRAGRARSGPSRG
jgi:adenosylmethionine---8-amino-7-oxononanoate aminotransferase